MLTMLGSDGTSKLLCLLLGSSQLVASTPSGDSQVVLGGFRETSGPRPPHVVDDAIMAALAKHPDPVDAFVALHPEAVKELTEPKLLHLQGEEKPQWMTEGDKLRLRRQHKKFVDITDHYEFYAQHVGIQAGKAHLPNFTKQPLVRPLLHQVSTQRMYDDLEHLTGFYNRWFGGATGEESAQWIHDQIAQIIAEAPLHSYISLEYFTHPFPQPSIIARFEPKVRNWSLPLTVIGAHQDSANYLFPLLPAPGADDDGSGTVTILEAFRVLATNGFTPKDGPVEFHWYAGEEGGNLGSNLVACYKKESGARIGAMVEFDATAFVATNSTESIVLVKTQADDPLTEWISKLGEEYTSLPSLITTLDPRGGSDYMSYTKLGYPSAFATEGDPSAGGVFPGDYNPYMHTVNDTMYVDDETGKFSFDHMAEFCKLAIAFAVEQAGWDNVWR
ncbi:peptidase family M28 [Apiospora phragmitis]|uniref:Peptide hydrolase n=1 Tax=Apiospora phragmitis TaxID=2905665 RepID=A0ABR1UJJ9_9PEZI